MKALRRVCAAALCALLLAGCSPAPVVLYTDLPQAPVAELAAAFTEKTGIPVTVTVQSDGAIVRTAGQPDDPCDVVMLSASAIETMLRMEAEERLSPVMTAHEAGLPWAVSGDAFVGLGGETWALLVHTELVGDSLPDSIFDLTDAPPGRCGLPDPGRYPYYLLGVYLGWDESLMLVFFKDMLSNGVQWGGGPADAARKVASGEWAMAITTLSCARNVLDTGAPLKIIIPDQNAGELGTLTVPVTVAAISRDKPNPNAKRLMAFLLRPESEAALVAAGVIDAPLRDMTGADGQALTAVRPLTNRIGEIYGSLDTIGSRLASLIE